MTPKEQLVELISNLSGDKKATFCATTFIKLNTYFLWRWLTSSLEMSNILEENEIHLYQNVGIVEENHNPVGLYKVLFQVNGIERDIDLLLSTRKKKRTA